jgi:hypothetical protein
VSGPANGQVLIRRHPWSFRRALTTGSNNLGAIDADSAQMLYVEVSGANYDFRYLLTAAHEGTGAPGLLAPIATLRTFSGTGASYGPPAFSVDGSGNLILTNASYPHSGLIANVDVLPLGSNRFAYGGSALEYGNR